MGEGVVKIFIHDGGIPQKVILVAVRLRGNPLRCFLFEFWGSDKGNEFHVMDVMILCEFWRWWCWRWTRIVWLRKQNRKSSLWSYERDASKEVVWTATYSCTLQWAALRLLRPSQCAATSRLFQFDKKIFFETFICGMPSNPLKERAVQSRHIHHRAWCL